MTEELTSIAEQMEALLGEFVEARQSGFILPTEFAAMFRALAIEAKSILDEELGRLNEFSNGLLTATMQGYGSGPSYALVEETAEIVRASIRALERKLARRPIETGAKPYVDPARIIELQALSASKWDFTRLLALCREINLSSANRCHLATAMLLRTILNHVPPALGFSTFEEFANNYGGPKTGKSFKEAMLRLEGSLRKIADMHLHSPIRDKEVVPNATQVDFAAELDVLLSEVVRVNR